jgi:general secretion pathway protein K
LADNAQRRRGSALLAVLWLAAALSAVAFTVAHTVRGETERAATAADGVRAYYLATGGVERALLWMQWARYRKDDNTARYWERGVPFLRYQFPAGEVVVDIIPESSKLSLNGATRLELFRLLSQVVVDPQRAAAIADGIVDWRTASPESPNNPGLSPSLRGHHASFEQVEELMLVHGMTPELFYGYTERTQDGRMVSHPGLRDCVSALTSGGGIDVNTAEPGVMLAAGIPPDIVARIVAHRRQMPYRQEDMPALIQEHPSLSRLTVGGGSLYTLRSTARLKLGDGRLSDLRRTVEAQVAILGTPIHGLPWQILRWYDNAPRLQ